MDYRTFDPGKSLALLLDRVNRAMCTNLRRLFKDGGFDVTAEQWMILLLLWQHNGRPQQEIADIVCKNKGTISPQIDGLVRRNLIVRVPDQHDRRRNHVWLTQRGKELEAQLVPLGFANMDVARQGIDPQEMEICKGVLQRICRNFETGGDAVEASSPLAPQEAQEPCVLPTNM